MELFSSILFEAGRALQEDDRQRMVRLVCKIRDLLIDGSTNKDIRAIMLPLVELQASNWQLSLSAKQFYYDLWLTTNRKTCKDVVETHSSM